MKLSELAGTELGTRRVTYEDRDALLYAVATGAPPERLELVYERDLRVLPAFALTLGVWAVEAAGELGAYDRMTSLHAAQRMTLRAPLPAAATVETAARVTDVWDKGKAALVEIEVTSAYFDSVYSIFLPGHGGWGGERGATVAPPEATGEAHDATYLTRPEQALTYRLTGDRHPVHVDPETARGYGLARPILHGLCTLGIASRLAADAVGASAADIRHLAARFAAPVYPGDDVTVSAAPAGDDAVFTATSSDAAVLTGGHAMFG